MAFSEKIKKEVRKKSAGMCVLCKEPFVEIHHIVPQSEGGDDTIDNAAPLCAGCHDKYGDNPKKRKQIIEMRDSWYEIIEQMINPKIEVKNYVYKKIEYLTQDITPDKDGIAIYHIIYKNEDFETASQDLFKLTHTAQQKYPNKKRRLYLDIEGHRLKDGAFDQDMFELQYNFILQNLFHYYSEIHIPLISAKNKYKQLENLPDELKILKAGELPEDLKDYEGFFLEGPFDDKKE